MRPSEKLAKFLMKRKKSNKRKYIVYVRIHFRGGERDPQNEHYEVIARNKKEAIVKAKKWLLSMVKFEVR